MKFSEAITQDPLETKAMCIMHKLLPTSFRAHGFDYKQHKRVGDVVLLEQSKAGLSRTWFEVVIVQRHDGYSIAGNDVAPAECMPSTSQWGKRGFTFRDRAAAEARFDALVKRKAAA